MPAGRFVGVRPRAGADAGRAETVPLRVTGPRLLVTADTAPGGSVSVTVQGSGIKCAVAGRNCTELALPDCDLAEVVGKEVTLGLTVSHGAALYSFAFGGGPTQRLKSDDRGARARAPTVLLLLMMMVMSGEHYAAAYPKGLFVQLESLEYPDTEVQHWFQTICDSHTVNSSTMYINDLVIQAIGRNGVPSSKQLALVQPYFHCFRTVFFGTAGLAPQPGDNYCEGIANNASRRAAIVSDAVQGAMWVTQHIAESQDYEFGWYISHEAWIDYFGQGCDDGQGGASASALATGYAEMLGSITREMSALRSGEIMWSPSVREHHGYTGQWGAFEDGWSRFFQRVPLLSRLIIQDAIGKASTLSPNPLRQPASYANYSVKYGVTCEDVAPYVHHLQAAATAAAANDVQVGVNMELFIRTGAKRGNVPGDPYEIERREECYRQRGVPVGPCFEVRFWWRSLYEQVKYNNATTAPDQRMTFKSDDGTVLIGAHYFGGWFLPPAPQHPAGRLLLPLNGFSPTGKPASNFFPFFPDRTPLLGNLSSIESTITAEVAAADTALDYFDVLFYDAGWDCGVGQGRDANLRWCLNSALAFALNTTKVWAGVQRMRFMLTYSNDIDRDTNDNLKAAFVGPAGEQRWRSLVDTWTTAMTHPRYLTINGRPVWKILAPAVFILQCGGSVAVARQRLAELRAAAIARGLKPPLLGGSDQSPMIPSGAALRPAHTPLPHPDGYMRYAKTSVNCSRPTSSNGCTIRTVSASSVQDCQRQCNLTNGCAGIVIADAAAAGNDNVSSKSCQLKSDTAPGINDPTHDTYVRVAETLQLDFTGTYNSARPLCPAAPGLSCKRYVNSWWPNATKTGAQVFPYSECGNFQGVSRGNHSNDRVPYLPNAIAGFDPRPWQEHDPAFSDPTPAEWEAVLRQIRGQCLDASNHFGFPDASAPTGIRPAFTICAILSTEPRHLTHLSRHCLSDFARVVQMLGMSLAKAGL